MSLEEAATKVKISKKSLDDYLMQLRSAKKFGFDFDQHNNDKVGVIRSFVRKKKEEERKRIQAAKAAPQQAAQGADDAPKDFSKSKTTLKQSESADAKTVKSDKNGMTTRSGAAAATRPVRKCRKSNDFKPRTKTDQRSSSVEGKQGSQ